MTPIQFHPAENAYIDHELSINLDSTEAFEGPEKLLEIWFYSSSSNIPTSSKTLRSINYDHWSKILDLVNCKILSIKSSSKLDAYLLSESSLFIYDHKLILKTCGTTTTLHCLDALFQLVKSELGWDFIIDSSKTQPFKVFYSRRSFMFPSRQKSIHKNWNDEVDYLNHFFSNGSHYLIGRIDNSHWHLYTTISHDEYINKLDDINHDETFEILMTEIPQDKASQFHTSRKPGFQIDDNQDLGHFLGNSTSNNTGLNNLYGQVDIHDAFAFTPCGYSSNTIMDDDSYYTLHVTPEKDWSYASFESNVNPSIHNVDNLEILNKVLNVFKPMKFQLTFFSNDDNDDNFTKLSNLNNFKNYKKIDKIVYDLGNYQLLYVSFELFDHDLINRLKIQPQHTTTQLPFIYIPFNHEINKNKKC